MHIQVVQDIVCPWCRIGKHNLDEAIAEGRLQRGQRIVLSGFGAGLAWGTAVVKW